MKNYSPIVYCQLDLNWKECLRKYAESHDVIGLLSFSFSHDNENLMEVANECGFSVSYRNHFSIATLTRKQPEIPLAISFNNG